MTLIPALEIGGSHVSAGLVDLASRTVIESSRERQPLAPNGTAAEILGPILGCAAALRDRGAGESTYAVAIPGPFDYELGIGRFEGVGKFDSLNGVDVRSALLDALGDPSAEARFVNDAEAFAVGEWAAGAARGHERAVGMTLGTGVGSAFLDRGRVVAEDPRVPPGGWAYRLRIEGKPLEDTISRRALLQRVAAIDAAAADADVDELAARVRSGDTRIREVFGDAFTALGRAMAPWLRRFEATALVVGGSMAQSWDVIEPYLVTGLMSGEPRLARLVVRPATLGEDAGLIGAAMITTGMRGGRLRSETDGPAA